MNLEEKQESAGEDFSLDQLIERLGNPDPQVRTQARQGLTARKEAPISGLVGALERVGERVRFEISKVLADIGEPSIRPMIEAIQHPNAHVRAVAARVLSLIGGETARQHLEGIAQEEKRKTVRKELREAAAQIARRLENIALKSASRSALDRVEEQPSEALTEKEREEKGLYFSIVRNLILSNWSKPRPFSMETEAVTSILDRLAKKTSIERLHAHLLRHTYATRFLLNGGDIFLLKQNLGHSTLAMVEHYRHIASREAAILSETFSPLDRMNLKRFRRFRGNHNGVYGAIYPNAGSRRNNSHRG